MIGLLERTINQLLAALLHPVYNHLYCLEKGGPATRNGQPIRVTQETDLLKTLFRFGIDSHREDPAKTAKECAIMSKCYFGGSEYSRERFQRQSTPCMLPMVAMAAESKLQR